MDDEGRRYERWFYIWGRRGRSDFTKDGELCESHLSYPPSVPRWVRAPVTVWCLMGRFEWEGERNMCVGTLWDVSR